MTDLQAIRAIFYISSISLVLSSLYLVLENYLYCSTKLSHHEPAIILLYTHSVHPAGGDGETSPRSASSQRSPSPRQPVPTVSTATQTPPLTIEVCK